VKEHINKYAKLIVKKQKLQYLETRAGFDGPLTNYRAIFDIAVHWVSLYPNMAVGMKFPEVVWLILTLVVFQSVTRSQSNSHSSLYKGK
jgi:hypothetical protein